jgi:hypothetical protein
MNQNEQPQMMPAARYEICQGNEVTPAILSAG